MNKLVNLIQDKSLSSQERTVLLTEYDYLSDEGEPHKSDSIFVFGATTPFRIQKAIELYGADLASNVGSPTSTRRVCYSSMLKMHNTMFSPQKRNRNKMWFSSNLNAKINQSIMCINIIY